MKKLLPLLVLAILAIVGTAFAQSPPIYADYSGLFETMTTPAIPMPIDLAALQPQTNGTNSNVNAIVPAIQSSPHANAGVNLATTMTTTDTHTFSPAVQPLRNRGRACQCELLIWTERGTPPPVLRDAMNAYGQNPFDNPYSNSATMTPTRNEQLKVSERTAAFAATMSNHNSTHNSTALDFNILLAAAFDKAKAVQLYHS